MNMKLVRNLAIAASVIAAASAFAGGAGKTAVVAKADLQWKDMGVPGVAAAAVAGDMDHGASRFFLKYPPGFVSPKHHHSTDHYGTLVSGKIVLSVDGREHELGPGSYFALTGMAPHVAKVVGPEEAVFFIHAERAWDVVVDQ